MLSYSHDAENSTRSDPVFQQFRRLPAQFDDRAALAGWQGPAARTASRRTSFICRAGESGSATRNIRAVNSRSRSERYSRIVRSAWISGLPPCGCCELQERSQLVRDSPRYWRNSENRMVHAPSHPARDAGRHIREAVGEFEADETFIGGLARNMHKDKKAKITGTGGAGKAVVMGIAGPRRSKVRVKHVPNTQRETLQG